MPVFTCIFALSATYFGIFARRAFVRCHTPMIVCLSNARSGDLHFYTSFVALHALVREMIPNTIHRYRVSSKKSYSSFWLVFKNACANLIQTYHEHSLKDGKNHSHKSKQLGRVSTSGMRLA